MIQSPELSFLPCLNLVGFVGFPGAESERRERSRDERLGRAVAAEGELPVKGGC